jgi:tripartite-type tricarboxylate transporter receptor subunit TctC
MVMKASYGIVALAALLAAGGAIAQTPYPDKPIRIVVGFAAGGPADITARVVGDKLSQAFGKPVVVDNVAGAGGNLATDRVAKAAPDGYTLLIATNGPFVINPTLYDKLPFDPIRDFIPISNLSYTPNILAVHNGIAAKNAQELAALARSQPGRHTFASAGVGSTQHLAGELFKFMAGIDIKHVPYRGIALVMPDLLAGRVSMVFGNITSVLPLARDGKIRTLAVTSAKRWAAMPDLPTMSESGFPGFDATAWFGLMAPAGTPAPIIEKLHQEAVRALAQSDVRARLDDVGMGVIGNTPAEYAAAIKAEAPQWVKVIKAAGIKASD